VLPPPSEEYDEASGIKKMIEYKFNEDGKKVKVLLMACFLSAHLLHVCLQLFHRNKLHLV